MERSKKIVIFIILLLGVHIPSHAQIFCKKVPAAPAQQSDAGFMIDSLIITAATMIVVVTLFFSVKFLVYPKENNPDHIKNIVKNEGF